jgi:hypothetical protein
MNSIMSIKIAKHPVLILLILLLIFSSISSQELVTIEFTASYMRSSSKLGYFIHTYDGEVLYQEVFDKKALKKGTKSALTIESPDSTVITIASGNMSYSCSPLRSDMKFDQQDYFPYSLTHAGAGYLIDLSKVATAGVQLLPSTPSNIRVSDHVDYVVNGWYNYVHPLFLPYNLNSNTGEYKFFTYRPLVDTKHNRHIILDENDVFSSKRFVNIELPEGDDYECDILLFSREYTQPYLLHEKPLVGQVSLIIPVPEILDIYKIGLVSKNEEVEIYSEFNNLDTILIQELARDILGADFGLDQHHINICESEIDFFHLFLRTKSQDDIQYNWVVNGLKSDNCNMVFPTIPEELAALTVLGNSPTPPKSGILYAMTIPDPINIADIDKRFFYDLYWRMSHNVTIQKKHFEW